MWFRGDMEKLYSNAGKAVIIALFVLLMGFMSWKAHADEPGNTMEQVASPMEASVQVYAAGGGLGTGTLIASTGLVLTAAHVTGGLDAVIVLHDGNSFPARIVVSNPLLDISILAVEGPTPLGLDVNCLPMAEGQDFWWIGNPLGMGWSEGQGIVAALTARTMAPWNVAVRAPFNHGDSGAGILDEKNNIRGVIVSTAAYPEGGMSQNGFIVPSPTFCGMLLNVVRR